MLRLLTVTDLNRYLRELLESDTIVSDLWVEGEIASFNRHAASGHCYMSLKDGGAVMRAVMFRGQAAQLSWQPQIGDAVLAHGRISLYEPRGELQLYVDAIRPAGVGLLYAQFERLKARLEAEGLFDLSRKRQLPDMPRRIGVATSPSGAALHDILTVLGRRFPLAEVLLAPCRVQGDGAAETIVEALYALYAQPVDVIIVARGGGSMEDLWAFNEEIVARAAFASPVPLVSGVGHETDTTIIDFVADLRAPTPSAAAELVTPILEDLQDAIEEARARLTISIADRVAIARGDLALQARHLAAFSPGARITRDRQAIDELLRRATARLGHQVALGRARLDGTRAHLMALSPTATLERGYAIVRLRDGQVVTEPAQAASGAALEVTVRGGVFSARSEG